MSRVIIYLGFMLP